MRRALALAIALAALPLAAQAEGERREPSVSVVGEGSVSAAPDLAMVTSGVVSRAPTAAAALKANAAAMTKVMAALKDAGVEDRDIATSGLSVQPQYDYGDGSGSGPRTPKLVGYEVRNVVTVRSRALDKIGDLIDSLVTAGSNQIENLSFEVSDRSEKLDGARREAMADARRKAEIYAAGVGASLGAPLAVSEQEVGEPEQIRVFAARKTMDAAPQATPIARGEQELRVRVNARWALSPNEPR